jgi:hypothetical protein
LLLKMPAGERRAAIDRLLEEVGVAQAKPAKSSLTGKSKEVAQLLLTRLKAKSKGHARAVLREMAGLLGLEVTARSSKG